MKKIMILAVSAILAANISAQEVKAHKGECKKELKECKFTPEQRVEMDIKYLTEELYLDEKQAENFAVTYREYVAEKQKLNEVCGAGADEEKFFELYNAGDFDIKLTV